jgi:hypothetical protein
MKRYLFSITAVIVVLAITLGLYAQPGGAGGGGGRGMGGGGMGGPGGGMGFGGGMGGMRRGGMVMLRAQTAEPAIAAIEAELKKLKDMIAEGGAGGGMRGMMGGGEMPSEEEMQKMMEDMQKRSEATVTALNAIGDQLKVLKGGRNLQSELQEANAELEEIQQIATEEKAEKTAKAIGDLIAKRQKAFEDNMEKLGIRGGRGFGGGMGGPGGGFGGGMGGPGGGMGGGRRGGNQ